MLLRKKRIYLVFINLYITAGIFAQLGDSDIAPNWTLTEINRNVHTLYNFLDEGKLMVIDFSATWCDPCWSYHNFGAVKTFYNNYGRNGTDEAIVFFIETDLTTTLANLNGLRNTQGNWAKNTPYPIIDLSNNTVAGAYKISYSPTVYVVYAKNIEENHNPSLAIVSERVCF